ncbi:circadian clock protein KaiC [Luteolibacter arcticus]|uniref:non-specific serine/threonine protein kinase n=1 Tax=Luteolibacter arcticus TaxID=1581411 RepID=A0ABT3GCS8_9BACT|nr:circadian clock protein KaiC [Luteolibacter arcticus]MCW1921443.1 circadian clock protein KaiC [Luteolibacter arcticus]
MPRKASSSSSDDHPAIPKAPTGIKGLDEITGGGLPAGRPTLLSGSAGAGKTLFATEFIVRGALEFGEPGVFMMFEENAGELTANVRSLGFDLKKLAASKKIILDHVHIERSEIEETGEYDLEGLFIRLGHAIDTIGAKRVVLDTIEALFAGLPDHAILRAELRRLFRWLKDRGVTALITGEKGEGSITRFGLEEYVADCVITLDHRVSDQISTRRLRVVKYRGSSHGTNEYPFLIGERGISVLPITSLKLDHHAPTEQVATGIAALDEMFGGKGIFRGSSMLVSGSPGTGKSSIGASFVDAACKRGEKALLFAYEESAQQIIRNMLSIGIDLEKWIKKGLLQIHSSRPTLQGLEQHLVMMHDTVVAFQPSVVAVDPISNLTLERDELEVKPTLMRLIDFLKQQDITAVFTSLTHGTMAITPSEDSQVGVSSLMDVWLLLRNHEMNGERNRTLYVLKARGMSHSNQVREFVMGDSGIDLVDVYLGANGVFTGTSRITQEARERATRQIDRQDHERKMRRFLSNQKAIEVQISLLKSQAESEAAEMDFALAQEVAREDTEKTDFDTLSTRRGGSQAGNGRNKPKA